MDLFAMMIDNNSSHNDSTVTDDSDNSINPPSLIYDNDSSSKEDSSDGDSMPSLVDHGRSSDNDKSNSGSSNNSVPDLIPQTTDSDYDTVLEVIPSGDF